MKKPFIYASVAALYIVGIVTLIQQSGRIGPNKPDDSVVAPMVMLSLLVLSVSVMGFLFVSEPIMLYVSGKKKEAVSYFMKTVGYFAIYVIVFAVLAFTL